MFNEVFGQRIITLMVHDIRFLTNQSCFSKPTTIRGRTRPWWSQPLAAVSPPQRLKIEILCWVE